MSRLLLLIGLVLILPACTNVKKISSENRENLESLCFITADEITYPEHAFFMSHGQGWAAAVGAGLGGAVGGAISGAAAGSKKSESEIISEHLSSKPDSFSEQLIEIFSNKIQNKMSYKISCSSENYAIVNIAVKQYGISYVPFTKSYRPLLTLYAEITDAAGAVIWKNQIAEFSTSEIVEKRRREEWFHNENSFDIMRTEFSNLAESILERFALHLSGDYSYLEIEE